MGLYKPRLLKITCTQSYICVGTTMNKQTLHYCFNYIYCAPLQIGCSHCNDQHSTCSAKSTGQKWHLPYHSRTALFKNVLFSTLASVFYLFLCLCFETDGERSLFFFFDFLLSFLLDGELLHISFPLDLLSLSDGVNDRRERLSLFLWCLPGDELPYLSHDPPSFFLERVL
jgi:hypothetical protein